MPQYEISVIVPIYNAEKYLRQCVDSILAQTMQEIEIILVDDGSSDDSLVIIKEYAERNRNVVALRNMEKGVINARITGLKAASGKYIGWVDSDDFIDPKMFKRLYELIIENDALVSYCDYDFYPRKVKEKEKWFKEYKGVTDWNLFERNTQCWNKLISKDYIDEIQLIHLYKELDEYANLALFLKTNRIVSTNERLYHYRVGIQSISGGSYIGKTNRFIHFVDCSSKLSKELLSDEEAEYKPYFEYRHIYSLLQLAIVASINKDKATYKSAVKELKKLKYKRNPYLKMVLDNNHGKKKSFALRCVIPTNYLIARTLTGFFYRG